MATNGKQINEQIQSEMLSALQMALRHAREAMPASERAKFDKGSIGPEWMFCVRDAIAAATREQSHG